MVRMLMVRVQWYLPFQPLASAETKRDKVVIKSQGWWRQVDSTDSYSTIL
jgi:hypothetical protein